MKKIVFTCNWPTKGRTKAMLMRGPSGPASVHPEPQWMVFPYHAMTVPASKRKTVQNNVELKCRRLDHSQHTCTCREVPEEI